jgi:sortase A
MTASAPLRLIKQASAAPDEAVDAEPEPRGREAPETSAPPVSPRIQVASAALTILAALLLGLVLQLVLVSRIQHYRSQRIEYASLRSELAQGTAPVGALDSNGKPVKMGDPVALIEIPSIGVREVIGQGTTAQVLASGPGHRRDTVLPGQAGVSVVMGRRAAYGGPFARLASLQIGDLIKVTTGQGVARFAVLDVRRAGDAGPSVPGAHEGRMLLMTATGAAYVPAGVLRVDAKLTSPVQPAGPVGLTAAQLPADEKVLQGQPGAWLPIVLWAQALLAASVGFVWARLRWGRWQAWLVGVPVLAALGLAAADSVIRLLPNVL